MTADRRSALSRYVTPAVLALSLAVLGCGDGGDGGTGGGGTAGTAPAPAGSGATRAHAPVHAGADVPAYAPPPATDVAEAGRKAAEAVGMKPSVIEPPMHVNVSGEYCEQISWAESGDMSTFNATTANTTLETEMLDLVFDKLIGYDNGRWEFTPDLAHSWEHTDDYLTWTFHLRKGIKFSDGEDFDADDVIFTFKVVFHPGINNSEKDLFRVGDAPFPTLEKVDQYTVRFHLKTLNAMFKIAVGNVRIVPEHKWRDTIDPKDPTYEEQMKPNKLEDVIGTGPMRVVEYSAAERIVLERNPYHWRQDRDGKYLPYARQVMVLMYKDLSARSIAFLDGTYDMITDIPPPDYAQFKEAEKEGRFRIHRLGLSLNTTWLCLNQHPGKDESGKPYVPLHKAKWFNDVRFRRAMSHATDRKNIVKLILDGKGEAIYNHTSPGNRTWYSESTHFPYDPDKAKALLAEIGFTDPDGDGVLQDAAGKRASIELSTNVENPVRVKVLSQIKADWAAVGVEVVTSPITFQELVHQLQDGHKWDAIVLGWGSGVPPDPLNGKNILLSSGRLHAWYPQQPQPANEWEEQADAMIQAMDNEPDEKKRVPMYAEYQEHFGKAVPLMYLFSQNAYAASKTSVRNLRPSVLRPQNWYNFYELWVEGDAR